MDICSEKINILLEEIERVRRRKAVDSSTDLIYLDPEGNIPKLKVYNNHLIFGRRGSGKTALVLAAVKRDLGVELNIVQDVQALRNYSRSKILIYLLKLIIDNVDQDLRRSIVRTEREYRKMFRGVSGLVAKLKKLRSDDVKDKYLRTIDLIYAVDQLKKALSEMEEQPDTVEYKISSTEKSVQYTETEDDRKRKTKVHVKANGNVNGMYPHLTGSISMVMDVVGTSSHQEKVKNSNTSTRETAAENTVIRDKNEIINQITLIMAELLGYFYEIDKKHIVLYLDDFYLLPLDYQPFLLQSLHDIYKNSPNSAFCFKVCSIPYRLRMNNPGQVDFSYKDDFSPIKLDHDLSQLETQRDHLVKILCSLKPELELSSGDISDLFTNDETMLYALIATGGVPRDFLVMFADLVRTAQSNNSKRISKEHVYAVIRELKDDKDNNIEIDSSISPDKIKKAIALLESKVVGELNTNVFLYPMDDSKRDEELLKNLVNLRYLHVIKESTSSENRKKEEFVAYLVDMLFYAVNRRMKPGFHFRHFWTRDNRHRLKEIDSAPIWSFPDLDTPDSVPAVKERAF